MGTSIKAPRKPATRKKKETPVEEILNARNLVVTPLEPVSDAKVVMTTDLGQVRIEGEVTPEKIQAAKAFDQMFASATQEIVDLAAYIPNESVREFVTNSGLTEQRMEEIKDLKPWSVFTIAGEGMMKTPDNKIETVKNYVYRLEQAVINVSRVKNSEIEKLQAKLKDTEETVSTLRHNKKLLESKIKRLQAEAENLFAPKNASSIEVLSFYLKTAYDKVVSFIIKLVSEEQKNG